MARFNDALKQTEILKELKYRYERLICIICIKLHYMQMLYHAFI